MKYTLFVVILSSGSVWNGRESAFITHLHYYLCSESTNVLGPESLVMTIFFGGKSLFMLLILLPGKGHNLALAEAAMIKNVVLFSAKYSLGRHHLI